MAFANQQLDWYFLEEDKAVADREGMHGWQAVDDEATGGRETPGQGRAPLRLYELLFGIALIYGVAVYLIWQQGEQRMAVLEQEVTALHNEYSQWKQETTEAVTTSEIITIETHHLRFEATPDTAELVKLLALLCEEKYQQLYQDFGMVLPIRPLRIAVDLATERAKDDEGMIFILPPAIAAERYGISEINALRSEIFTELSKYVLDQALKSRKIKSQWRSVILALHLYLQLENGDNPGWQQQPKYLWRRHLAQSRPINMVQPVGVAEHSLAPDEVADPLIEFILETYGYSKLPALLDAFEQHAAWQTVALEVFGLSAIQFEEQWHAYLQAAYPITNPYASSISTDDIATTE